MQERAGEMGYLFSVIDSPVGALRLVGSAAGLAGVLWAREPPARVPHLHAARQDATHPLLCRAAAQLNEYFQGRRTIFDIPLDFVGTPFQLRVWTALTRIPFGETRSYGDIARAIGAPAAVRAVGAANGRNPVSIIAACHRVIGANGSLTGFAGGLEAKAYLLRHEATRLAAASLKPHLTGQA
ncbi:methylated-DNA--[protein]-cysteine S-methyltransferase [Acidocella facilis]|uniref:methylated-DNA--[protein]-cysteine S-methyltransferase n=1 Tax=Acidocella facilis TaxID=525 RepID=UPI001F463261|nr:methylated-DNA--[protein]-cysteine S-methyltransferase [Acidocella facilis]